MKKIMLGKLADPDGYLDALAPVYNAIFNASAGINDLRNYVISSLMVKQIWQAKDMLHRSKMDKRYYCYTCEPFVYQVEDTDSISDIMSIRDCYVYNSAMA